MNVCRKALGSLAFGALTLCCIPGYAAPCDHPDPQDPEQVFGCMAIAGDRRVKVGLDQDGLDCLLVAKKYKSLLQRPPETSGRRMDNREALRFVPSCTTLAAALKELTGKHPYWVECGEYPGQFAASHFIGCIEAQRERERRPPPSPHLGCNELIAIYERGLRSAHVVNDGRQLRYGEPNNYTKPDCGDVLGALEGR